MADTAPAEPHAEFEEKFSDLHDGSLPESERAAVQAHLADCAACAAAYAEFEQTMSALTSIKRKPPAPDAFVDGVAETIHRRSAGRFFGRKTFGDRVPFGVLLIIAMVVLVGAAVVLWASSTGSLRIGN
jgi:anti-sigma factor RsiW